MNKAESYLLNYFNKHKSKLTSLIKEETANKVTIPLYPEIDNKFGIEYIHILYKTEPIRFTHIKTNLGVIEINE
jgi:hypothetical protein